MLEPRLRADARARRQHAAHLHGAAALAARSRRASTGSASSSASRGREHVCFLDDARTWSPRSARTVRAAAANLRRPSGALRLPRRQRDPARHRALARPRARAGRSCATLYDEVKQQRARRRWSATPTSRRPSTSTSTSSTSSRFNVYLHREADFRRYLSRLQNLAERQAAGADRVRHRLDARGRRGAGASSCRGRCAPAFESGVAGTFVFSWTDDWFTGGSRSRTGRSAWSTASAAEAGVRRGAGAVHGAAAAAARASAARLGRRLRLQRRAHDGRVPRVAARRCDYPNYEVIVVNDGSTDRTLEITGARRYGDPTAAHRRHRPGEQGPQRRRATSAPRRATGEIVAYTDSDCVVDPDWLTYLVYKFVRSGFVAVGGPNFPPPEASLVPAAVAVSPGGPTHVLLERRGRRAHPRLQHGLPQEGARRRSAASIRSSRPPATTSTSAGACRTRATRSASARRRWSGTSAATR